VGTLNVVKRGTNVLGVRDWWEAKESSTSPMSGIMSSQNPVEDLHNEDAEMPQSEPSCPVAAFSEVRSRDVDEEESSDPFAVFDPEYFVVVRTTGLRWEIARVPTLEDEERNRYDLQTIRDEGWQPLRDPENAYEAIRFQGAMSTDTLRRRVLQRSEALARYIPGFEDSSTVRLKIRDAQVRSENLIPVKYL